MGKSSGIKYRGKYTATKTSPIVFTIQEHYKKLSHISVTPTQEAKYAFANGIEYLYAVVHRYLKGNKEMSKEWDEVVEKEKRELEDLKNNREAQFYRFKTRGKEMEIKIKYAYTKLAVLTDLLYEEGILTDESLLDVDDDDDTDDDFVADDNNE